MVVVQFFRVNLNTIYKEINLGNYLLVGVLCKRWEYCFLSFDFEAPQKQNLKSKFHRENSTALSSMKWVRLGTNPSYK